MDGRGDRYFIKATNTSPQRGPLNREELAAGLVPELIRRTATIRGENDTEWRRPDASLLAAIEQLESDRRQKARQDIAADEQYVRQVSSARVRRGIIALGAGVALTLLTYLVADAVGVRTFLVFTGLIGWGAFDIIRGFMFGDPGAR